jgi:O-antigen/teichoic acid export membrane protein
LLDALSLALPVWFIAANYGADDTGQYSMAQRLLAAPAVIIAMAAGQVFLKRAGDLVRGGQSPRALLRRSASQLGAVAAGLLLAVVLAGSPLLSLVLGAGWRTDLGFLLLAMIPALIRSVVSPLTGVFIVRGQLRSAAVWQVAYFCGTGLLFVVLAGRVALEALLLAFCVSEALFYAWYFRIADRVAD